MKLLLIIILLCGSTWTPGYVATKAAKKALREKEEPACVQNEKEPAKAPFHIVPSVYIL